MGDMAGAYNEAYIEARIAHLNDECDPLCCPWCNDEDPTPDEFEIEEE